MVVDLKGGAAPLQRANVPGDTEALAPGPTGPNWGALPVGDQNPATLGVISPCGCPGAGSRASGSGGPDPTALRPTTAEMGVTTLAVTRVMSPTRAYDPNPGLLLGFNGLCSYCGLHATEPTTCSGCGRWGHPHCLRAE